jgi:hypothetical protein
VKSKQQLSLGKQLMRLPSWWVKIIPRRLDRSASPLGSIVSLMKTSSMVIVCLAIALNYGQTQVVSSQTGASQATTPAATASQVVEAGPNHRVWQWQTYETLPNGQTQAHTHSYTELASGLNYLNASGQWAASQEIIEPFAGGAIARHGQHQVIFANNLNTADAIDMQTPDGKRLRSNVLGLMYYDPTTGDAVQIAQIQSSEGQLVAANQVLYPNAFNGVKADVLYIYKQSGLEQDIILREQPPAPEAFGLNSETAELEVFTELDAPEPDVVADLPLGGSDLEADQTINWGAVSLGRGKAFILGNEEAPVKVIKRFVQVQGRYFLQEKVRVSEIQSSLASLPEQAANETHRTTMVAKNLIFPKVPLTHNKARPMRVALGKAADKGYVLDYVTVNSGYTNYIFQSDTTYYISGVLASCGTNTFEGGTVIKYATNGAIEIFPGPPGTSPGINFQGSAYRPVVFTSKDDNTVGDSMGSGTPSGYYGNPMLYIPTFSPQTAITGLRMSYAKTGVILDAGTAKFYSAEFLNCGCSMILGGENVFIGNALFANTATNFILQGGCTVNAQNCTFKGSGLLVGAASTQQGNYLTLTNCILANVTNLVAGLLMQTNGNYNGFYQSPYLASLAPVWFTNSFYPFQTVGAGNYYQVTNSAFIGVGTTNLNATVLTNLASRTVYPPVAYSNLTLSGASNFSIQAWRDTNTLSLGFHYDPLDYVFGNVTVQSNFVFGVGTAVGWFEANGGMTGISLKTGGSLTFQGTATSPCNFSRYSSVQEGGNGNWTAKGYLGGVVFNGSSSANPPTINALFTKWEILAGGPNQFRDNSTYGGGAFTDNEFYGGNMASYVSSFYFTNCLVFRVSTAFYAQANAGSCTFQNCDFYNGMLLLCRYSGQSASFWNIENTAFDGTAFVTSDNFNGTNSTLFNFNAYNTNNLSWQTYNSGYSNTGTLEVVGPNDVKVPNYNWQSSWFGNFYQSTNSLLIQAGSTNANLLGLYHFTTQTNQVPETNSIVTIGYHYVATDAYGNPLDSNGDGIPDYLEDANGDGIFDAGDLGEWKISPFGLAGGNGLQVFTPLKP